YVFISPGNHDPYYEKSFYNIISWPNHVHIFKGKMTKKEINELGLVVYGAGFAKKYERETLIDIKEVDFLKINMMVLHGDISSKDSKNDYNPININDISSSNMD
ncbi:DNA repair exonuclease, partial [Clostridium saudiense]|nr:DNA repair exonuclease [Clostridium saudiense]